MQDRHRPGLFPFGEPRSALERVDRRSPQGDAAVLQPAVKLLEVVPRLIQKPSHPAVDDSRDLGPGVDAPEAEQRIRPHLRSLPRFRHQPLAERDHDRVVLRKRPREVPESFAHHVSADGVGSLLDLVVLLLVLPLGPAEVAEQARAEGRCGRGHGETARDAAWDERARRDRLTLRALDLHVLQPEVKPQQHRPGVERPLRDQIPLLRLVHPSSPFQKPAQL